MRTGSTYGMKCRARGRAAGRVAPLLITSALFLLAACGAGQTQNSNAGPQATPAAQAAATATPTQSSVQEGDITVTPITHASLQLEYGGKIIHVDPTSPGDYSNAKQADLVLITDIHPDHLDPAAIARIRKQGAPVVAPQAAAEKIDNPTVLDNGETKMVAGISVEAVPMYNLQRGPAPGQLFHP
jgi:hypothetical protein